MLPYFPDNMRLLPMAPLARELFCPNILLQAAASVLPLRFFTRPIWVIHHSRSSVSKVSSSMPYFSSVTTSVLPTTVSTFFGNDMLIQYDERFNTFMRKNIYYTYSLIIQSFDPLFSVQHQPFLLDFCRAFRSTGCLAHQHSVVTSNRSRSSIWLNLPTCICAFFRFFILVSTSLHSNKIKPIPLRVMQPILLYQHPHLPAPRFPVTRNVFPSSLFLELQNFHLWHGCSPIQRSSGQTLVESWLS